MVENGPAPSSSKPDGLTSDAPLRRLAGRLGRIGGWWFDASTKTGHWSSEVYEILDAPQDCDCGLDAFLAFATPAWQESLRDAMDDCRRFGKAFSLEADFLTATGCRIRVLMIGEAVVDDHDRVARIQGAIQDVTLRSEGRAGVDHHVRQVLDRIPLGVWTADAHGIPDFANRVLCETIGSNPKDVPPADWAKLVHPDDRDRVVAEEAEASAAGVSFSVEMRLPGIQGEGYRWYLDTAWPVRNQRGEIVKWYGTLVDVHDLKMAEEKLRESESRFRLLAENITEVFWISDADKQQMHYVSPGYEVIWGRSCATLYDDPTQWIEAIHQADRPHIAAAAGHQAAMRYQEEYRIVRPDGTIRWIYDRAFPVADDTGGVTHIVGIAEDITERKKAEWLLKERVKELGCLYHTLELTTDESRSVSDILFAVASRLPEGFANPDLAVARVTVGGADYTSANWQTPKYRLERAIQGDAGTVGRIEIGYPGEPLPRWTESSVFLEEEQTLLDGVAVHIGRMLTDRKMAEQVARSERIRMVGELTGGIAHDFNNLLTVILGSAELLVEKLAMTPDRQRLARTILNAAERGGNLTNRLLAFARRQHLDPQATDLERLIDDMEDLLERTLGEHVEIETAFAPDLAPARVDRTQLENAVLNLCINARDAMAAGGKLTIEVKNVQLDEAYAAMDHEVSPGDYVMLSVSDSGVGMTPEVARRAFEPFFTTKSPGKGSGLGLSMVFGFVKQSQGHVRLYSEPDCGTTVRLYLPRAVDDETEVTASGSAVAPVDGGKGVILVVEDDTLVRNHVSAQLMGLGYEVVTASDGPEALRILQSGQAVDLLFTDVVMPGGLSGRDLADQATRLRPDLPVLFTSGYTEKAITGQGRLHPKARLLSKPYRRRELADKIREVLNDISRTADVKQGRA